MNTGTICLSIEAKIEYIVGAAGFSQIIILTKTPFLEFLELTNNAGLTLAKCGSDVPPSTIRGTWPVAARSKIIICPNTPQTCAVNTIILLLVIRSEAPWFHIRHFTLNPNSNPYESTSGCLKQKSFTDQWERADQVSGTGRCILLFLA